MKKLLTVVLVAVFALMAFTACSGGGGAEASASPSESESVAASEAPSESASEEASEAPSESGDAAAGGKVKFGVTFQTLDNTIWLRMEDAMRAALRDGDELVVLNAEYDSAKQVTQVEDLIAQQCNAIFVVAVDGAAIMPALKTAKDAGVPIIPVNIPPDSDENVTAVVQTDNYLAGVQMGEGLLADFGDEPCQVGVLAFDAIEPARLRIQGFKDTVEGHDNVEIVITQDAMPSTEEGLPVLENMLQAKPDINAFVCVNDLQAFGGIQVKKAHDRPDIKIYAVDGNPIAAEEIIAGNMDGTSAQFPNEEGRIAVETAYTVIDGGTVEKEVLVTPRWINKDNAEAYLAEVAEQ
ncbi:MAG: substrate-binding domain-containing protein [Christensenellaceae bacterium]|jgi:ribose transport system substrate-binding protein